MGDPEERDPGLGDDAEDGLETLPSSCQMSRHLPESMEHSDID